MSITAFTILILIMLVVEFVIYVNILGNMFVRDMRMVYAYQQTRWWSGEITKDEGLNEIGKMLYDPIYLFLHPWEDSAIRPEYVERIKEFIE